MTTAKQIADETQTLMSHGEIDLMKDMVERLPDNPKIVIIGAGAGTSSVAILESRPDAIIFSIDTIFPTGGRYEPGEKENLKRSGFWFTGQVIQIIGRSQLVGKGWPYPVDMVFVDGDHKYDAVKADILAWQDHIQPDGLFAFHDYADKTIKPKAGVKQAVDELLFEDWEPIGHHRYLMILERKS